jgi:hypothetical protein
MLSVSNLNIFCESKYLLFLTGQFEITHRWHFLLQAADCHFPYMLATLIFQPKIWKFLKYRTTFTKNAKFQVHFSPKYTTLLKRSQKSIYKKYK